jgi:hypothetical protein
MADKSMTQKTMFLSSIGLFTFIIYWPIIIVFHFTNVEFINFSYLETLNNLNVNSVWIYISGSIILAICKLD